MKNIHQSKINKNILIQGALDVEIQYMIDLLENKKVSEIATYEFYEGTINDIHVVVSKTLVGTINATIATCIGITTFHPYMVINQGIAGSHTEHLHVGDIVIGEHCCNINAYKMPIKKPEEGSNPFEWKLNKRAKDIKDADFHLVNWAEKYFIAHYNKTILRGNLGSGDVFNREYDRIKWLQQTFNNLCEDMESIGTYSVCNKFNTPCLGIRIISNNELLSEPLDKGQAVELQKLLVNFLKELSIASLIKDESYKGL